MRDKKLSALHLYQYFPHFAVTRLRIRDTPLPILSTFTETIVCK